MGSLHISSFKFGMDRRRPRAAGVAGTLWDAKNVVISRGGDIERPKAFVSKYTLPANLTKGLSSVRGQLYVFGSGAEPEMPAGVRYQRVQSIDPTANVTEVMDVRPVDGKLYVIARFDDGHINHFYNGVRVEDWDTLADDNATASTMADYFAELINGDPDVTAVASGETLTITAKQAGTPFTLATDAANGGSTDDQVIDVDTIQANVAAVDEVAATGTVTIAGGTSSPGINRISEVLVDGDNLLAASVNWTSSNDATASAVAAQINNGTVTHGYTAISAGAVVTITAPNGEGAAANGLVVSATTHGNVVANTSNMAGGVTAVSPVAQVMRCSIGGTFEPLDLFLISINNRDYYAAGRASAMGVSLLVLKKRIYSPANSLWWFCKLNDPTDWTDTGPSSGAGFLNVSSDSDGTERLIGAVAYSSQAAVFSRRNIWLYNIDTDAENISFVQAIPNTGSLSARAMLGYGNLDVFYPDESGIRSLRARDGTTEAYADDVGAPIDSFLREHLDSIPESKARRAVAALDPRDKRYMLAIAERVYTLSFFPKSQITAWTYLEPGIEISDFARAYNRLYARAGDIIYLYGGDSGTEQPTADDMPGIVKTPYATMPRPQAINLKGYDVTSSGGWRAYIAVDPDNEDATISIGVPVGCTFPDGDIDVPGRSSHIALNWEYVTGDNASISNASVHFEGKEPSD